MDVLTHHFVCEESAFGSLESLIEQGLEEDAVLEGQRDEKVSQIVDELQGVKFSIIGEVEARNVQKRLNMSAEERLNTLLSETEDVAREDQIFIRDGVEMAMAEKKKSADETVSPNNSDHSTAISSADGAKVLKKT